MNHGHTESDTAKSGVEGPCIGGYNGQDKPSETDLHLPVKEYPYGSALAKKPHDIAVDSPAPKGYC